MTATSSGLGRSTDRNTPTASGSRSPGVRSRRNPAPLKRRAYLRPQIERRWPFRQSDARESRAAGRPVVHLPRDAGRLDPQAVDMRVRSHATGRARRSYDARRGSRSVIAMRATSSAARRAHERMPGHPAGLERRAFHRRERPAPLDDGREARPERPYALDFGPLVWPAFQRPSISGHCNGLDGQPPSISDRSDHRDGQPPSMASHTPRRDGQLPSMSDRCLRRNNQRSSIGGHAVHPASSDPP